MPILDDFNRASLGSGWESAIGTIWAINASTTVRPVTAFATTAIRRTEASFPNDQYSQAKVELVAGAEFTRPAVAVRMDASGNCYFARLNSTSVDLYKRVAGTVSYVNDTAQTVVRDTFYTLKIEVIGTSIKVYLDGVEKLSSTDSSLTSGKPGLYAITQSGGANLSDFDDFECTDAVSAGVPNALMLIGAGR